MLVFTVFGRYGNLCKFDFMTDYLLSQGASKTGTAPDGTSYLDAAEKDEIKALLR